MATKSENKYTGSTTFQLMDDSTAVGKNDEFIATSIKQHEEQLSRYKSALHELSNYSIKKITTLEGKHAQLNNQQKDIKEGQDKIKNLLDEFKTDKQYVIGILGVLVSIFTFVSFDIQILKSVTDYLTLAGLSIVLFAILISFNIFLFILGERWINRQQKFTGLGLYYFIIASSFILGIGIVGFGEHKNSANINNDDKFIGLQTAIKSDQNIINNLSYRLDMLEKQQKKINHTKNKV